MLIVNEISLNRFITYTNSVYDIDEKFKGLRRNNSESSKVMAYTVAKTMFASTLSGHRSINELNGVNKHRLLRFNSLYRKREYIPRTHGLRDCIIDTDYKQIELINKSVINKCKENKIFRKNKIDGLFTLAFDGVSVNETNKDIEGLPEREHRNGKITKYLKYTVGMNVGPTANIIIGAYQHQNLEKVLTESGRERAKTDGETKAFEHMMKEYEKSIGGVIDVIVLDALYGNKNVTNMINKLGKYFVIRLKDERLNIYKDAKGIFDNRKPDEEYEIVKVTKVSDIKYSPKAKKANIIKTKERTEKRITSDNKLCDKRLIREKNQVKKNSTVKIKEYETVIIKKQVWYDEFDMNGYDGKIRVVRSRETSIKDGEEIVQEIYVITNMLSHDVETILKIMHYRWHIENCGFRTLKQKYHIGHIFIGEINAINYIIQMKILVFNLLELYMKIRLKNEIDLTWSLITKIFERAFHDDEKVRAIYINSG